ncbi:MAG: hypothetical protein U0325_28415 [Polyangiales bacterium]
MNDGDVSFDPTLQALELAGLLCTAGALTRRIVRWRRALRLRGRPREVSTAALTEGSAR